MRHVALQVPAGYGDLTLVDERFVAVAHEQGLAVHVWTIEEEPRWSGCAASGWTGSSPTARPRWSVCSTGSECAWQPRG